MSWVIGDEGCHGGIFAYKADGTETKAQDVIKEIHDTPRFMRGAEMVGGGVCGEVHRDKADFVAALTAWSQALDDPGNAYLCIYSHMGPPGINCIRGNTATRVTWDELADALPKRVRMLWLVGCKSYNGTDAWKGRQHPVLEYVLVTDESRPFSDLVKPFVHEISTVPITPYDEMPAKIAERCPDLAKVTTYLRWDGQDFRPHS